MKIALQPKHVVISGSARGIGRALVQVFAESEYRVSGLDILQQENQEQAERLCQAGYTVQALHCDVANSSSVQQAATSWRQNFGPCEILINNAGFGGPFHLLTEVSDSEWEQIIGVNLRSVFYLSRAVLPDMAAVTWGRLIHIASIQGFKGAVRSSTYSVAKHGVIGYTRNIAAEWGQYGITSNAICPGYVDTAMGIQADQKPQHAQHILAITPVKRIATPQEVAKLALYLAGEDTGYLNGAVFAMDGGITSQVPV